jgi:integrase
MKAFVYKQRLTKDGKSVTKRIYRGRFRLQGETKVTDVSLKTTDKLVAERRLAELITERERERAGIVAPLCQRTAAQKPLAEHLDDFVADLFALGRTQAYVSHVRTRVRALLKACKWTTASEVNPDAFVTWRAHQTQIGPKTLNEYLNSFKAFMNWLVAQGRFPENPLRHVKKADVRGKQQQRRAFTDEEFKRLIDAATDQKLLYLTAAFTGLRMGELRQLIWNDVKIDHEKPHIIARAATTKNRRQAIIPLHPELIPLLAASKGSAKPNTPVFTSTCCHHAVSARRFVADLEKAGIARIDDMGRKLDFHCLRYTFATKLARMGVSQRMAQELLRHSDPRLTANIYTDVTCLPTFDTVASMPWVEKGEEKESERDETETAETTPEPPEGSPIGSPISGISCLNEARVAPMQKGSKVVNPAWIKGLGRKLTPVGKAPKWRRGGDSNPNGRAWRVSV